MHIVILFLSLIPVISHADGKPVYLTSEIPYVDIKHNNKIVRIKRNPDNGNIIDLDYGLTSRPCPPYCIQPIKLAEGIETIAELELIQYLQAASKGSETIMLIDSREKKWLDKGMIPGAINIPWQQLYNKTSSPEKIAELITLHFNVARTGSIWNFQNAKTLIFYCNGPWCGQSATNIRALLNLGYPASKLKWYRGGMQSWLSLGLTVVTPD